MKAKIKAELQLLCEGLAIAGITLLAAWLLWVVLEELLG